MWSYKNLPGEDIGYGLTSICADKAIEILNKK